jgi:hypothetical protein
MMRNRIEFKMFGLVEKLSLPSAFGRIIPPMSFRGSKWHLDLVVSLASILTPRNYLEIGIHKCGLFNRLIPYCDSLTGVDLNPRAVDYMAKSNKTTFINTSSVDYWNTTDSVVFDLIMIDGNHSKEFVRQDFVGGLSKLAPNGIMLLHDTYPGDKSAMAFDRCSDGYKVIEEMSTKTDQYEMVTIPRHPGLTICRKRTNHLDWE